MDQYKENVKQYFTEFNASWGSFDSEIQQRQLACLVFLLEEICRKTSGDLAIDVGCGGGGYTQLLPNFFNKTIGYDFTEKLLEKARTKFPHIQFECGEATKNTFAECLCGPCNICGTDGVFG